MNEQQQPKRNKTCLEAGQLIAWRDGALPIQEANEVLAHLAVCAHCTAEDRALMRDRRHVFDLLSRVDPPPGAQAEPAAALARFQERLTARSTGTFPDHYDGNIHSVDFPPSRSESDDSMLIPVRLSTHRHRLGVLAQTLVAALVIAVLLGTILLLLRSGFPSTSTGGHPTSAPAIGPVGAPVTVHTQAQGLEMTMRITPGPYFLNEMLAADLSITNHSHHTFILLGTPDDPCHSPLRITMTGGESPYNRDLESNLAAMPCIGWPGSVQLQPTQTITMLQYAALTSSGHVILTAQTVFVKTSVGRYGKTPIIPATSPLDGHWPSLRIMVQARVPSDRLLSLRRQGGQVIVNAPAAVRGQLIYVSFFYCITSAISDQHGGADYWISLVMMAIQKPDCGYTVIFGTNTPGKLVSWIYIIGVPGYAMVSGKYPS